MTKTEFIITNLVLMLRLLERLTPPRIKGLVLPSAFGRTSNSTRGNLEARNAYNGRRHYELQDKKRLPRLYLSPKGGKGVMISCRKERFPIFGRPLRD